MKKTIFNRRRLHLFEFEDFNWFPDIIRSGGTDFLRYFLMYAELYRPTTALLHKALAETRQKNIIDLCSGGGGYTEQVYHELCKLSNDAVAIQLTDKFPNLPSYRLIKERTRGKIDYADYPVDVFAVPQKLSGFRVLYSAIHHFTPAQVRLILADAVNARQPIGIFDGMGNKPLAIAGLWIVHPILFLVCTPFFKPFKWSRLLFTYIIPFIPLYTIWDGMVSVIRLYRPEELREIADSIEDAGYTWQSGHTRNRFGIKASYLIGYPDASIASNHK